MGQLGAAVLLTGWLRRLFRRKTRIVAGDRVIDMDAAITELHGDSTQFNTMLMRIASAQAEGSSITYSDSRLWDDWAWTSEWELRRAEAVEYFEKQMRPNTIISWMEDTLFPRVGSVLRGDGQFLRTGDIVRVVAAGQ